MDEPITWDQLQTLMGELRTMARALSEAGANWVYRVHDPLKILRTYGMVIRIRRRIQKINRCRGCRLPPVNSTVFKS